MLGYQRAPIKAPQNFYLPKVLGGFCFLFVLVMASDRILPRVFFFVVFQRICFFQGRFTSCWGAECFFEASFEGRFGPKN